VRIKKRKKKPHSAASSPSSTRRVWRGIKKGEIPADPSLRLGAAEEDEKLRGKEKRTTPPSPSLARELRKSYTPSFSGTFGRKKRIRDEAAF